MKKIISSILALLTLLLFATPINVTAATEDYAPKYLPLVQVRINVGNTNVADSEFIVKLVAALKTKGVGASKIDVGYASTVETDFSVTDPTKWTMYDHMGWWDEIYAPDVFREVFDPFLATHVANWNPEIMEAWTTEFDYSTMLLSIINNEDNRDSDNPVLGDPIPFMTLTELKSDLETNMGKFDVDGWATSLEDEALVALESDEVFLDCGLDSIDYMWYDSSLQKAYFSWYDDCNGDYYETEFQAYEDYIRSAAFFESLTFEDSGFYGDGGSFDFLDIAAEDNFTVDFPITSYGGTAASHYPAPDKNPDGDNPIDYTNDPHIIIHEDGSVAFYGYGEPAYKDFMLSIDDSASDKHFKFDLDEEQVDYHSMEGGGFLFSIQTDTMETADASDDTMSGYAVLFGQYSSKLYKLTDVNIDDFHNTWESYLNEYDNDDEGFDYIEGIEEVATGSKDTESTKHSIQIDIVNNYLTIKDNDVMSIENLEIETIGNKFGPFVSYANHGCEKLSYFIYNNLKMGTSVKVVSKAQDNVGTIEWTDGAYPVYINLEDTNDATLDVEDFVTALKADGVNYIGVGLNASKVMHDAIIAGNGLGEFFDLGSYPIDVEDLANAVADYLWPLLEPKTIENIENVILDKTVNSSLDDEPVVVIPDGVIDAFDDLAAGNDVTIELDIELIPLVDVPEVDLTLVNAYVAGLTNHDAIGIYYLDMSMFKLLNGEIDSEITELLKPITITLTVPEALRSMTGFKMIRVHEGVVEVINGTYDATNFTLTFTTDKFSTYGIQYSNPEKLPDTGNAENAGLLISFMGLGLFLITRKQAVH